MAFLHAIGGWYRPSGPRNEANFCKTYATNLGLFMAQSLQTRGGRLGNRSFDHDLLRVGVSRGCADRGGARLLGHRRYSSQYRLDPVRSRLGACGCVLRTRPRVKHLVPWPTKGRARTRAAPAECRSRTPCCEAERRIAATGVRPGAAVHTAPAIAARARARQSAAIDDGGTRADRRRRTF